MYLIELDKNIIGKSPKKTPHNIQDSKKKVYHVATAKVPIANSRRKTRIPNIGLMSENYPPRRPYNNSPSQSPHKRPMRHAVTNVSWDFAYYAIMDLTFWMGTTSF